jgi:hypothetical protein
MLSYTRERAEKILRTAHFAILATTGPAGLQASEFPCEAFELDLYLLLPGTSDHLFNLEQDGRVALHTEKWELTGKGHVLSTGDKVPQIGLVPKTGVGWYVLIKVIPGQIQVLRREGWGPAETFDFTENQ